MKTQKGDEMNGKTPFPENMQMSHLQFPLPTGERVRVRGGVLTNLDSTSIAKGLRKKSTVAEKILWKLLRDRRFSDFKFRRQHAVGEHILDFFCVSAKLNIEVDGGGHGHPSQKPKDTEQDKFLASYGIRTLRFWNHQVKRNIEVVRQTIWNALHQSQETPHLDPLPRGERKSDWRASGTSITAENRQQAGKSKELRKISSPIRGEDQGEGLAR
jgi:very-short-patch-repair endonuclease